MSVDIGHLISRMEWAAARGLAELTYAADGARVSIRREHPTVGAADGDTTVPARAAGALFEIRHKDDAHGAVSDDADGHVVAPMTGVCHLSPEEGGTPFVAAGDPVEQGQTVCVLEVMKVMTSVTASRSGTVAEIYVKPGETVEAGRTLMRIR